MELVKGGTDDGGASQGGQAPGHKPQAQALCRLVPPDFPDDGW